MQRRKQQRLNKRRRAKSDESSRSLRFQHLESRRLLAGDLMADIKGLWVTVGNREYYTSDLASVNIDMHVGETLQVTGIDYQLHESYTPEHGVIAFESYVRREHGAAEVGSYDYTDGRFGDPVAEEPLAGAAVSHHGLDGGWELDVIDNRIAVVAIRYFENESAIEDRIFIDVNVSVPERDTTWTEALAPVQGDWETDDEGGVAGDSSDGDKNVAGLTVIETGSQGSQRYEVGVRAKTVEENAYANGFVVVDYRDANDFVYAGLRSIADKWVIGHFNGKFNDLASMKQTVEPRQIYDVRVAVDGSHVALAVDGVFRVSHEFDRTLDQGAVGLANQYAYTHFADFNFFDNTPRPVDDLDDVVRSDDGTVVTIGDGEGNPVPVESRLDQARAAYEDASRNAESARLAVDEATAVADEARQRSNDTQSYARSLDEAAQQAQRDAAGAVAAHDEASQGIKQAEELRQRSSELIDVAKADHEAATKEIKARAKVVKERENDLEDLNRDLDKMNAEIEQRQHKVSVLKGAADETADQAKVLAGAASVAEKAAVAAELIAEKAENAPKAIRKAAEKAAKEARKIADKAVDKAEDASEQAEKARDDVNDASEELAESQKEADELSAQATDAGGKLLDAKNSLDEATKLLSSAIDVIEAQEAARDAAAGKLDHLKRLASRLADEAETAADRAEDAARVSAEARAEAERAAGDAEHASIHAERSRDNWEVAHAALVEAELALQQIITDAEQDTAGSAGPGNSDPDTDSLEESSDDHHVYALNFNHQDDGALETVSGTTELVAGQVHLGSTKNLFAITVLDEEALPEREATRMYATVRADALPGRYQNGFIVFDYESPENFKYAGAWAGADRWAIGEVIDGRHSDVATIDEVIGQGPAYELQVWIEDGDVTLLVEGQQKLQHTFAEPIDDGQLGLANYNARSRFDQVAVMRLHGGNGDIGIEDVVSDSTIDPAANDAAIIELF